MENNEIATTYRFNVHLTKHEIPGNNVQSKLMRVAQMRLYKGIWAMLNQSFTTRASYVEDNEHIFSMKGTREQCEEAMRRVQQEDILNNPEVADNSFMRSLPGKIRKKWVSFKYDISVGAIDKMKMTLNLFSIDINFMVQPDGEKAKTKEVIDV